MTYKLYEGAVRRSVHKLLIIGAALTLVAVLAAVGQTEAKVPNNSKSLGKTTVGTDVSEWEVGDGQFNGEFVVATGQGVELGLRIQERFVGPLDVTGDQGNRVGVYEASTGTSDGEGRATWNYDWHVDLTNAKANASGKTLADYDLVLEQDFTGESLFGALGSDPVNLPMPDVCDGSTVSDTLCQQSWNPSFGNTDFDPEAEGTYNLRLVLTPKTFNGPPLAAAVQVHVTD